MTDPPPTPSERPAVEDGLGANERTRKRREARRRQLEKLQQEKLESLQHNVGGVHRMGALPAGAMMSPAGMIPEVPHPYGGPPPGWTQPPASMQPPRMAVPAQMQVPGPPPGWYPHPSQQAGDASETLRHQQQQLRHRGVHFQMQGVQPGGYPPQGPYAQGQYS